MRSLLMIKLQTSLTRATNSHQRRLEYESHLQTLLGMDMKKLLTTKTLLCFSFAANPDILRDQL